MKLSNLKIAPKLGILVGVTLLGLCVSGVLAGYLMKREMVNARIDQAKSIVDLGRNYAAALKKRVDAGELTKDAAMADLRRYGNAMTYDNGSGYLFGTSYDGITQLAPDPKQIGSNRMDVVTNGRKLSVELMDGVKANGSILLYYDYVKPGQETPISKIGYAVAVPGFDMYLGTGAYLSDIDAKMGPVYWLLGLAMLGIVIVAGGVAWLISRGISRPLELLGARMKDLADGKLEGEIPGVGRGDEVGAMASTVQIFKDNAVRIRGLEKTEADAKERAAAERRSAMEGIASDFERSVNGIVRSVSSAAAGMQSTAQSMTATASDASSRAATVGAASPKSLRQCRHGCRGRRRIVELGCGDLPPGHAFDRSREPGRQRCRAHQRHRTGALDRRREDRRGRQADPLDRGADQPARAQRHHRSGARRRVRPGLRGRGLRGQGAGEPDREGDRGNLRPGRGDADLDQRRGHGDLRHHPDHRRNERDHRRHFCLDRAAGRSDPRDRPQHPVGRGRLERDQRQYRQRHLGRGSDRHCRDRRTHQRPRAGQPVRRAAQRGRRLPRQGPCGVRPNARNS
ncbi:methyl-accepting chemotaxis protein [Bradyrhizobium sp. i1.3.1]